MEPQQNDAPSNDSNFNQFSLFLMSSNPNLILPIVNTTDCLSSSSSSSLTTTATTTVCNTHQLVSTNSFELNAPTSLSEDSGLPHTNSSISSGDSFRVGLCKYELELTASDGEDSQFDSLDNCSDGGMSAENFNTLKKGPLAPIDPPPEFQDSPQTTLLRSPALQTYALKLSRTLIASAVQTKSIQSVNDVSNRNYEYKITSDDNNYSINRRETNTKTYEMYASDSFLNRHIDNIYDVPNTDEYPTGNKIDYEAEIHLPSINNNNNNISKLTSNAAPNIFDNNHRSNRYPLSKVCEIYDYDIYYKKMENQVDNLPCRKTPILYSPLHYHPSGNRPNSRNSLNSRLSSSHNSLTVPNTNKADDSIFITQAMSHDALTGREIVDFYNVPVDSDIYSLPVDVIKPEVKCSNSSSGYKNLRGKLKYVRNNKKRRKVNMGDSMIGNNNDKYSNRSKISSSTSSKSVVKRHSVPENTIEPMHMTLDEVKRFYHSLYSSSSESSEIVPKQWTLRSNNKANNLNNNNNINYNNTVKGDKINNSNHNTSAIPPVKLQTNNKSMVNFKINRKLSTKDECANNNNNQKYETAIDQHQQQQQQQQHQQQQQQQHQHHHHHHQQQAQNKKPQFSISMNLKQKFCSIFRFRKTSNNVLNNHNNQHNDLNEYESGRLTTDMNTAADGNVKKDKKVKFSTRALPPLPAKNSTTTDIDAPKEEKKTEETAMDFAANIEKVKEYGWYWGPISSEAAEKILSNEPDGSFIVRDSSDDHYIFSLTFKLNNSVRHVRIEQDQGTFSFGSCAKFKSHTIMEFIENAVESSRSGRYLFFFHRRPEHGPMRVQLTNPVSRFKHIQSLQHMCRFVIRKAVVRKDLIQSLPLPRRLLDYISYKNCYSEQVESDSSPSQMSGDGQIP